MKVQLEGVECHVATGGKEFDPSLPTVLFLHGSGLDHRGWALQTRWFAFHGFSVLAPDFPGHSLSDGEAFADIESSASWLNELLEATGVRSAHVVGHSQGFLSAIELASQFPERIKSLTGIGTGAAIPVNQMLLDTAKASSAKAAEFMLQWGFGSGIHQGVSPTPGMQPIAIGYRIMSANPLATDLNACANYSNGLNAAANIKAPSCMVLAGQDKMTPLRSGKELAAALNSQQTHVLAEYGHMLPMEAPKQVLHTIRDFIVSVEGN
ncbi:MAG: alpha/beta fold hydrolase [Pseudomonadales bacterium]